MTKRGAASSRILRESRSGGGTGGEAARIPAYIVMPHNVPRAKQDSVLRYGAKIEFCEPNMKAREAAAARIMGETGAQLVHPFR